MNVLDYNYFHDWTIDRLSVADGDLLLHVYLSDDRKIIHFTNVRRLIGNNFMTQNVIYDLKIIDQQASQKLYEQQIEQLDRTYGPRPQKEHCLAVLSASVGVEMVVEFIELKIIKA